MPQYHFSIAAQSFFRYVHFSFPLMNKFPPRSRSFHFAPGQFFCNPVQKSRSNTGIFVSDIHQHSVHTLPRILFTDIPARSLLTDLNRHRTDLIAFLQRPFVLSVTWFFGPTILEADLKPSREGNGSSSLFREMQSIKHHQKKISGKICIWLNFRDYIDIPRQNEPEQMQNQWGNKKAAVRAIHLTIFNIRRVFGHTFFRLPISGIAGSKTSEAKPLKRQMDEHWNLRPTAVSRSGQ